MSWLRIDDGFAEHPKIQSVSERARWMHIVALCYSARNLNDGILTAQAVKVVAAIVDKPCRAATNELVRAGLWLKLPHGGYQIKDYLEWNPDAETVKRLRKERQEAGRKGGKSAKTPVVEPNEEASAKANAQALASTGFACTPSLPIPSHESSTALSAGLMTIEEGMKRLIIATGVRSREDIDKITRTVVANKCGPGAIKLAIAAATGPGVRDPLAVALSELKKRRAA